MKDSPAALATPKSEARARGPGVRTTQADVTVTRVRALKQRRAAPRALDRAEQRYYVGNGGRGTPLRRVRRAFHVCPDTWLRGDTLTLKNIGATFPSCTAPKAAFAAWMGSLLHAAALSPEPLILAMRRTTADARSTPGTAKNGCDFDRYRISWGIHSAASSTGDDTTPAASTRRLEPGCAYRTWVLASSKVGRGGAEREAEHKAYAGAGVVGTLAAALQCLSTLRAHAQAATAVRAR
ncbi:hypothetical protein B0H15DRAFT_806797 [Mycena belliarum]|uniref:Uncharacterized protein n=1 Tax=Mycena belliarum TaxID=1033014 RepID=A0AAD6XIM0_9AGAR|nr:hypothetical protein B0H15DRAFT_806797 [Mycena belliae]